MTSTVRASRRVPVWMAALAVCLSLLTAQSAAGAETPASARAGFSVHNWPAHLMPLRPRQASWEWVRISRGARPWTGSFRTERSAAPGGPWRKVHGDRTLDKKARDRGLAHVQLSAPEAGDWWFRLVVRVAESWRPVTQPLMVKVRNPTPRPTDLRFDPSSNDLTYMTREGRFPALHVGGTSEESLVRFSDLGANGRIGVPVLSPDRRLVAFWSTATNLVASPDDNFAADLFVRDLLTQQISRVDTGPWGTAQGGDTNEVDQPIVFAPDSQSIAFETARGLWLHEVGTSRTRELVHANCVIGAFNFSLDGSQIFVEASQHELAPDSGTHIVAVDLTGSRAERFITLREDGSSISRDSTFALVGRPAGDRVVLYRYDPATENSGLHLVDSQTNTILRSTPGRWDVPENDNSTVATIVTDWGDRVGRYVAMETGEVFRSPVHGAFLLASSPDGQWRLWATDRGGWDGGLSAWLQDGSSVDLTFLGHGIDQAVVSARGGVALVQDGVVRAVDARHVSPAR